MGFSLGGMAAVILVQSVPSSAALSSQPQGTIWAGGSPTHGHGAPRCFVGPTDVAIRGRRSRLSAQRQRSPPPPARTSSSSKASRGASYNRLRQGSQQHGEVKEVGDARDKVSLRRPLTSTPAHTTSTSHRKAPRSWGAHTRAHTETHTPLVQPPPTTEPSSQPPSKFEPYVELLRPQNVIPSMMLVAMGAYLSTRDITRLWNPAVISMAFASPLVAVGSCVLNDWFDMKVDAINKPTRQLVQGMVPSNVAFVIGTCCLLGALIAATPVLSPSIAVRRIVFASVVAVTLYTPVLKPVPFLKNAVVAFVTAASVVVGSLATGAPADNVFLPAALTFMFFYHREILMDIDDVDGDAKCGIMTVPRLLGKPGALITAMSLLLGATAACTKHLLDVDAPLLASVVGICGTGMALFESRVATKNFTSDAMSAAIAWSPLQLILMMFAVGFAPQW